MARIYLLSKPGTLLNHVYVVDHAVGRNCPNKPDDVALVQFLVRRVLEGWNDVPAGLPLAIDGFFGTQTEKYIKYFQEGEQKRVPGFMMTDGAVHPPKDRTGWVIEDTTAYTIIPLNTHYSDRFGKAWHSNLAIDPLCPLHLLPSIFWH